MKKLSSIYYYIEERFYKGNIMETFSIPMNERYYSNLTERFQHYCAYAKSRLLYEYDEDELECTHIVFKLVEMTYNYDGDITDETIHIQKLHQF